MSYPRLGKFLETQSVIEVTGAGERGNGDYYRVSVWDYDKVLKIDGCDGCTTSMCI